MAYAQATTDLDAPTLVATAAAVDAAWWNVQIVRRHGGCLWAEPAPGGGTIVRFDVPDDVGEEEGLGRRGRASSSRDKEHAMQQEVRRNAERSRYELVRDGRVVGVADYRESGDTVVLPHTEIDRSMRGQGLGDVLVRAALDDLRAGGHTVVPACWFVAEFIEGHPEYRDLLRT